MSIERGNDCTNVKVLKMPKQLFLVECIFCHKQFRVGSDKIVVFSVLVCNYYYFLRCLRTNKDYYSRIRAHLGVEIVPGVI
jgi:hypothetical protein